jgi:hypothetical protein
MLKVQIPETESSGKYRELRTRTQRTKKKVHWKSRKQCKFGVKLNKVTALNLHCFRDFQWIVDAFCRPLGTHFHSFFTQKDQIKLKSTETNTKFCVC